VFTNDFCDVPTLPHLVGSTCSAFSLTPVYTQAIQCSNCTAALSAERSVWLAVWVEKDGGIDDAAARDSDVQDRGRKADHAHVQTHALLLVLMNMHSLSDFSHTLTPQSVNVVINDMASHGNGQDR
jgi:hypothetical protein